ncbi:zinc ribbon domain-containing protein [Paraferrimonas haliotis]|uniref:zinc ribbon domain-containing protein n=1 Tax=Paraferrimonas haliotis TaxID=2013866 RepID=UPI000BA93765|nr:zinc ribbon domain-containing protein [Paraferrimonas haliotis]
MALIHCPICDKRNSDKAKACQHCNTPFDGDQEALARQKRIAKIKKQASLTTHSFASLTMVVAAITVYFWGLETPSPERQMTAYSLGFVGSVWYVVSRVRLFLSKRGGA